MTQTHIILSPRHIRILLILILGLFPLVGMTVDLISPSLPAISSSLHMSRPLTKNMIALYLYGYAIGCFIFGFLSDAWGRQKILLGGLLTFTIVSLLPVFFPDPVTMLATRFLQGLSIACFSVNARPIASDILPPKQALSFFVLVTTMWGIGPIIGPWIGGYLQVYFGWKAGFVFFAAYAAISLALLLIFLPETHLQRHPFRLKKIIQDFTMMVQHKGFIGATLVMAFSYSLLIAFNIMGPFLFQLGLGYSPIQFGHVALWMGACFLMGTFICRSLVKREQAHLIYQMGLPLALVCSLLSIILAYFIGQSAYIAFSISLILFTCCGLFNPAATGFGMSLFPKNAGSSSAIMYFVNLMITSTVAWSLSFVSAVEMLHMMWVYLALMSSCAVAHHFLMQKK
jgi:DHA1 family bicyclomycin/chloramphenicol resistance-like MFS transporter